MCCELLQPQQQRGNVSSLGKQTIYRDRKRAQTTQYTQLLCLLGTRGMGISIPIHRNEKRHGDFSGWQRWLAIVECARMRGGTKTSRYIKCKDHVTSEKIIWFYMQITYICLAFRLSLPHLVPFLSPSICTQKHRWCGFWRVIIVECQHFRMAMKRNSICVGPYSPPIPLSYSSLNRRGKDGADMQPNRKCKIIIDLGFQRRFQMYYQNVCFRYSRNKCAQWSLSNGKYFARHGLQETEWERRRWRWRRQSNQKSRARHIENKFYFIFRGKCFYSVRLFGLNFRIHRLPNQKPTACNTNTHTRFGGGSFCWWHQHLPINTICIRRG